MAITQNDLESLLYLSQVRDLGKDYDRAREKIKIGTGLSAVYDRDVKERLGRVIENDPEFFADYLPEHTSSYIKNYISLDENKPENTPGYKAFVEFNEHKGEILSSYINLTNEKLEEILNSDKLSEASRSEKNVLVHSVIGKRVQDLAQTLDGEIIRDFMQNGSDEEKEILDLMLRDPEFYNDFSKDKRSIAEDISGRHGVRTSLVKVSDAQAYGYGEILNNMDIRRIGKYFATQDNRLNTPKTRKFFGNSPYSIAGMAKVLI